MAGAPATEVAETPEPEPAGPAIPELSPAECSAQLATRFPALFNLQQPLPLKLRIQADIQERAPGVFTRKTLSIFLHRYTTGTPYLQALAHVPQRYDLDGQPAGEVSAEHRDAATAEVARRRALVQARKAAEQAARKPAGKGRPAQAAPAAAAGADAPVADASAPGDAPARAPRGDRAHRNDRPPRPGRPPGSSGPQGGHPPREDRAARPARPPRPPRPEGLVHAEHAEHAVRPEHLHEPRHEPRHERAPADAAAAAPHAAADSDAAARRERAALLRAFDSSPLTKANFCVLKRMRETDLDAQLALARKEAADRPQPAERAFPRPDPRPDPRQGAGPRGRQQPRTDNAPRGPRPQRG